MRKLKLKKFLIAILLISAFSSPTFAFGRKDSNVDDYTPAITEEDLNENNFFKSPMQMMLQEVNGPEFTYAFDYKGRSYKEIDPDNMPLFKQLRLKMTNQVTRLTSNDETEGTEKVSTPVLEKIKFWNKKNKNAKADEGLSLTPAEGSIAESIQSEAGFDIPSSETLSLETGISEQVTQKELMLDAENVNFDEETNDMVATGRPVLFLPQQNTKVIADKMTYNQDSNILKGIGNVVVIKDNMPSKSDYIEVDMNEETIISDNLESITESMIMNAEKAIQKDAKLIFMNGNFHSEVSQIHRLSSRMIGPRFGNMIVDEDEKALFFGDPTGNKIHLNIDKIYVEAGRNHDKFTAKKIEVTRKGQHWFTWPSLTAYTNKERDYFEASYPEFGSRRKLGMFIGPGFVFGGPGGSVIKAIPFLNYQHGDFGFGGALKYKNTYNTTEVGYGSAADVFFLRGYQRLDDHLFLQYSANSFMDEWFLGARMPKYMAEVYYDRKYSLPNFLTEKRGLTFRHRAGFGLMEDNDRNYYGEKFTSAGTTTTRLRYMAEIAQKIYSYEKPENKFYFDLSVALQGSAAVYGTGDTQFIGRIGPRAHIQYKNWMQDLGYFQSGYDDETPIPRYDAYRYGHSAVYISEIIRLNKYLSVGWSGMVNMSNDSPNGKLFQENRFVFAIGPDDLKIRVGYDFVRRTTYFGFDVAFDTKGTSINYGRMEIKNPERLGKRQKEDERKLAFAPSQKENEVKVSDKSSKKSDKKVKSAVLEYAQVIEIEDPDKETVD